MNRIVTMMATTLLVIGISAYEIPVMAQDEES